MTNLTNSNPCPERCPICKERCYGRVGHGSRKTAGKGFAELHQCRKHVWGLLGEWHEAQRSIEAETRREIAEAHSEAARGIVGVFRRGLATGG
jgi:hypothetical protein